MGDAPKFTRRHWGRTLLDGIRWPLSMMETKHRPRDRRLSQFRVILMMFAVSFCAGWLQWVDTWPEFALGMVILLAIPTADLFWQVPVGELLGAMKNKLAAAAVTAADKAAAFVESKIPKSED